MPKSAAKVQFPESPNYQLPPEGGTTNSFVAVGMPVSPVPPAQIRTCRIAAYGSYLGCMASKRTLGCGCRMRALGIHASTSRRNRTQVKRRRCPRRRSARYQRQMT